MRHNRSSHAIGPTATAQRYREEAERVRRDAEHITDQIIRRQLLDIAAQYERLADNLDPNPRRKLPMQDRPRQAGVHPTQWSALRSQMSRLGFATA
jgi:hypothetical protein